MGNKTFGDASDLYDVGRFAEAFELFLQLAHEGDVSAMTRVACMYGQGEAVECDIEESIRWDMRAVELGSDVAMHNLGVTYRSIGDTTNAKAWLERASKAGSGESAVELAKIYLGSGASTGEVRTYLETAIGSTNICEESRAEANEMLRGLMK